MVAPAIAGGLLGAAGVFAYAVRGRCSKLLAPSICRGPAGRPVIALTFDDGPSESTPKLLEVLAAHGARATFFQCGMHVRRLPGTAREVLRAGHEIGNHTDTHPAFYFRSPEFILGEIARAQSVLEETVGVKPSLFRPPYGVRWFGLRRAQRLLRLTGVMWTAIALDWKLDAESIAGRLIKSAANGAILCLHDGREAIRNPDIANTIEATRRILPVLKDRGFRFETITEMLCATN